MLLSPLFRREDREQYPMIIRQRVRNNLIDFAFLRIWDGEDLELSARGSNAKQPEAPTALNN